MIAGIFYKTVYDNPGNKVMFLALPREISFHHSWMEREGVLYSLTQNQSRVGDSFYLHPRVMQTVPLKIIRIHIP